jgi:hypothetical protein
MCGSRPRGSSGKTAAAGQGREVAVCHRELRRTKLMLPLEHHVEHLACARHGRVAAAFGARPSGRPPTPPPCFPRVSEWGRVATFLWSLAPSNSNHSDRLKNEACMLVPRTGSSKPIINCCSLVHVLPCLVVVVGRCLSLHQKRGVSKKEPTFMADFWGLKFLCSSMPKGASLLLVIID